MAKLCDYPDCKETALADTLTPSFCAKHSMEILGYILTRDYNCPDSEAEQLGLQVLEQLKAELVRVMAERKDQKT